MNEVRVPARRGTPRRERGIVMWVALVVLIVMSLAGLAMMRQMGGGLSIAGNVAFKENATSSADAGTEAARQWVIAQSEVTRQANAPAAGYYATWGPTVDPTQMQWGPGFSVPVNLDAGLGNVSDYQVHRLCVNTGPVTVAGQTCSDYDRCKVSTAATGCEKSSGSYASPGSPPEFTPYYRVTVRTQGPRNTISYTQVILN